MKDTIKNIQATNYEIRFGNATKLLNEYVKDKEYSKILVLVDDNTKRDCLPKLGALEFDYNHFCISPGEEYKTLVTAQSIWNAMINAELDRHSLVINIGGGVIGDMGGFCASTYMRGIDFVQLPTTLLAQVDASVGGKLAIDMDAYKNIIGMFNNPKMVVIDDSFLETLPHRELMSGYAELLKHGLIRDIDLWKELISMNPKKTNWQELVYKSVLIKNEIVTTDPYEKGLRKILNFGHTIGHAIESELLFTDKKILHGEAITIGMICESQISVTKGLLSQEESNEIKEICNKIYPELPKELPRFDNLISRMKKDKKNKSGIISFTLLNGIGNAVYDQTASTNEISASLKFYTD